MNKRLTNAEVERFRRDGFLFPLAVLPSDKALQCHHTVERLLFAQATNPALAGYLYDKTHLVFTWFDELAHNGTILDIAEDLLGPNILLWTSSILIKRPKSAAHFTWHQDATYWGLEPPVAITAWLALGEVNRENGCVRAIPETHLLGQLPHVETYDKDVMLLRGQRVDVPLSEDRAVDFLLRPGEMSIHQSRTVHGSAPNRSDRIRIGCSFTFIPTSVVQTKGRESAMLMRGVDKYGHFDLELRPIDDMDEGAVIAHRAAVARMQTYKGRPNESATGAVPSPL